MNRLVADCELSCPADAQIKVLERCLQYLSSCGDNVEKKDYGWLLLARILEKCNAECLRAGQSRLGKKLADIIVAPSLMSGVFVRQLIIRNPQTGELHANIIEKIVLSLLDSAVREQDPALKEIAAEIFSLRYGCSKSSVLLQTLEALLREHLIGNEDRTGLLNLPCLGMTQYSLSMTQYLFELISHTFAYSKQGELLERDRFLAVVENGLKNVHVKDSALRALAAFCTYAGNSALPVVPLIVSMLVSQLSSPTTALFNTLEQIGARFGSSSTLYKHLFVIFSSMKHPLDEQEYGESAGSLLSVVIRSSSFLIQPEILLVIQKAICNQIVREPSSVIYRSILRTLLSSTHPLVPVPVHVARTVTNHFPDDPLTALCDSICRPRLLNLDARRVLEASASSTSQPAVVIPKEEAIDNGESAIDQYKQEVNNVMEEISRATAAKEATVVSAQPSTTKNTQVETKKRQSETKASAPKKKVKKAEVETVLHAGEESVDDILESFCVD